MKNNDDILRVGMAQISPVWLDREQTLEKIISQLDEAGKQGCELVVFGEGLLPGYPFWLSFFNGASFNSPAQKALYAHYVRNAINIEAGQLQAVCDRASLHGMAIYLGIIERAPDRGGHSLYCSLVYIRADGEIASVHRKLQPTYEERLVWAQGDGHGLQVHSLKAFTVGGLNCWENWMPLARTALYGLGENLHVAVWPGSERNTEDITRFIAKEGRSFVVSVSSLMHRESIPENIPFYEELLKNAPEEMANGGSCIAAPDGSWIVPPKVGKEGLFVGEVNMAKVLEERQNFDAVGHYSRPSVTQLSVNRARQTVVRYTNNG